jgi:hypothetical protein
MVRLGLIALLLVCITITGVYAVWTYAGTNDIADAYAEAKVTIADVELTGANGTYKIESNLVLTVDQANDNHEAKLVFGANDGQAIYLRVTFTPAANAPQTIKENGVPSELYFGTTTEMKYDGVDIFTFSNKGDGVLNNIFHWTKQTEGENVSFVYELDQADLEGMISLSQTFVLDTKAEHDAFRVALTGNIVARVTDGTVNQ